MQGKTCPKCGRGKMSGPVYANDSLHGERLLYTCQVCGYRMSEDCADQQAKREDGNT